MWEHVYFEKIDPSTYFKTFQNDCEQFFSASFASATRTSVFFPCRRRQKPHLSKKVYLVIVSQEGK